MDAFWNFFKGATYSGIGTTATIVALLLSLVFYALAVLNRKLKCLVQPFSIQIVKADQTSALTVAFNGTQITTDVTAKQVVLWNEGRKSIRQLHMLRPVVLTTPPGHPILEATVRKISREVVEAALDTTEIDQGRLLLDWFILEKGDGMVVQLIYAGDAGVNIGINGIIEGQKKLDITNRPAKPRKMWYWYLAAVVLGLIGTIVFSRSFADPNDDESPDGIYTFRTITTETRYKWEFHMLFRVWSNFIFYPVFIVAGVQLYLWSGVPVPPKKLRT